MRTERVNSIIKRMGAVLIAALLVLAMPMECRAAAMTPCGDAGLEAPKLKARSAMLYSVDLDEVLCSKNPDKRFDPYSVTKLMTAYLAVNALDPDQTVTISKEAADDDPEGSTMKLVEGEKVTVEQLLYGAMMLSGNDAAYALAETTSGSVAAFVDLMNETAKEWGCTNTHFANPMGWQDKKHYTSAADLLTIAKHVLADEKVTSIVFTKKYKMPATNKSEKRVMKSHTTLIHKKYGVLGGKTGYWEDNDCSVVLEANRDELTTIIVLLKDTKDDRVKDIKKLLDYANKRAEGFVVDAKGAETGKVWIRHGEQTHVMTVLSDTVHAYPKKQRAGAVKTKIKFRDGLEAPLKKGTKVGTYTVKIKGQEIATRDVLLTEDVAVGWFPSNIFISNRATIIILVFLAGITLIILLLRMIGRKKRQRRKAVREAAKRRKAEGHKIGERRKAEGRETGERRKAVDDSYRPKH